MIRKILVPLDLTDHTDAATFRACEIAKRIDSTVTGLTVVDTDGIVDAVALPFNTEFINFPPQRAVVMLKDATGKLEKAGNKFREDCTQNGVKFLSKQLRGNPADGILDAARFTDLVIMGTRSHFHFETEVGGGDTLSRVLNGISVPLLLTPADERDPIERTLIAFDGSPASTRALHHFAQFSPLFGTEIHVVTSSRDKRTGGHLLDEAVHFLNCHGVKSVQTEFTKSPLEDAMRDRYFEWADLIVAGIHSKGAIKRFFVGSFTQSLIEKSHQALLLSQ